MNDIGILIVIGIFYRFQYPFLTDDEFYFLGKVTIGVISAIIFLNFVLFLITFILGLCKFLNKYCVCDCCKKIKRVKEEVIIDPYRDIKDISVDEIERPGRLPTPDKEEEDPDEDEETPEPSEDDD